MRVVNVVSFANRIVDRYQRVDDIVAQISVEQLAVGVFSVSDAGHAASGMDNRVVEQVLHAARKGVAAAVFDGIADEPPRIALIPDYIVEDVGGAFAIGCRADAAVGLLHAVVENAYVALPAVEFDGIVLPERQHIAVNVGIFGETARLAAVFPPFDRIVVTVGLAAYQVVVPQHQPAARLHDIDGIRALRMRERIVLAFELAQFDSPVPRVGITGRVVDVAAFYHDIFGTIDRDSAVVVDHLAVAVQVVAVAVLPDGFAPPLRHFAIDETDVLHPFVGFDAVTESAADQQIFE